MICSSKALNKGEYSTEPVKTTYGYHVIYCVDKAEKTDKISRKDRMQIVEELAADIMAADSDLYTKVLIKMREDAKLKFYDKDLDKKYTEYCSAYVDEETGKVKLEEKAEENETTEESVNVTVATD